MIMKNTINDDERDHFDDLLDRVMYAQPPQIHTLLEEVPLIVEDYPSRGTVHRFCELNPELDPRRLPFQLCGLYTGFPVTVRNIHQPSRLPDRIQLFRRGILLACRRHYQDADIIAKSPDLPPRDAALLEQIRITLLHEIGHHFGLGEEDLTRLGYG